MKGLIVLALIFMGVSAYESVGDYYNTTTNYLLFGEGALSNLTSQMGYHNASICILNTHRILDQLYGYVYAGSILNYLIVTRDLFRRLVDEIDYGPEMLLVVTRFIEV